MRIFCRAVVIAVRIRASMAVSVGRRAKVSRRMLKLEAGRGINGCGRTLKASGLRTDKLMLDSFTQSNGGFSGNVLVQQVFLHSLHWLLHVRVGQYFTANHIAEKATDSPHASLNHTAFRRCLILLVGILQD